MIRSALVTLALLFIVAGCAGGDKSGASAGKMLKTAGFAKKDKATGTQYIGIRAKNRAANAFLIINVPRDLWPPFRYEVTGGLYDPKRSWTGGGFFCSEVSVLDSNPLDYYDICGQPNLDGINVFTADKVGTRNQRFFSSTTKVDFAVEHDGTNLILSARASGSQEWFEIDRFVRPSTSVPYRGSIGASRLATGQEAGFDLFRLTDNGTPPTTPSATDAAREKIFLALDFIVEAIHALNQSSPDTESAEEELANAVVPLAEAREAVANLLLAKKYTLPKAAKHLKQAEKKLGAAVKKMAKGKKAKSILNLLKKSAKFQLTAAYTLSVQE